MVGRWWWWVVVVVALGASALAQVGPGPEGTLVVPPVPREVLAPEPRGPGVRPPPPNVGALAVDADAIVAATLAWSLTEASDELRRDLLDGVHLTLARAYPSIATRWSDPAALCGFVIGSGGTSHVDGGGSLNVINRDQFDASRDRVDVGSLARLANPLPDRLIIVDEFDLGTLEERAAQGLDPRSSFLETGIFQRDERGYQVLHGHLVLHHVAALLLADGHRFAGLTPHGAGLRATFVRGDAEFTVDLHPIVYDDFHSMVAALEAVDLDASGGPAAVVLSWGLVGCALRDAYRTNSLASDPWAADARFRNLADFAYAVVASYDEAMRRFGTTPVTDDVCRAVDAASGYRITAATAIHCEDLTVRALVGGTALFASYARIAEATAAPADKTTHRYYAAAGNEGLPYPMAPGSFKRVLAVAACKPSGPRRAPFSNAGDRPGGGEAIAAGGWFPSPGARGRDLGNSGSPATRGNDHDLGYWGTSFAAPLAALASGYDGVTAQPPTYARLCEPVRWIPPED